jgi:hypothetical protein
MPSASTAVAVNDQPSRQALQAATASKPNRVTGKLAEAIDIMIEAGAMWDAAAVQAGLTVRSMRLAMQRPHVIAYLKQRREVFRVNASAGNIHRLLKLAVQEDNKAAAVTAIKAMEQIGEVEAASGIRTSLPGLQIVIVQGVAGGAVPGAIDVTTSRPNRVLDGRSNDINDL